MRDVEVIELYGGCCDRASFDNVFRWGVDLQEGVFQEGFSCYLVNLLDDNHWFLDENFYLNFFKFLEALGESSFCFGAYRRGSRNEGNVFYTVEVSIAGKHWRDQVEEELVRRAKNLEIRDDYDDPGDISWIEYAYKNYYWSKNGLWGAYGNYQWESLAFAFKTKAIRESFLATLGSVSRFFLPFDVAIEKYMEYYYEKKPSINVEFIKKAFESFRRYYADE